MESELSAQEKERLVRESVDLVHDFGASELRESTSPNVTVVLIPMDNPELEAINREAAENAIRRGDRILMISASRGNPGEPYTIFNSLQSVQPTKPI